MATEEVKRPRIIRNLPKLLKPGKGYAVADDIRDSLKEAQADQVGENSWRLGEFCRSRAGELENEERRSTLLGDALHYYGQAILYHADPKIRARARVWRAWVQKRIEEV